MRKINPERDTTT